MQLRYDEDFVEAATFLCTTGRLGSAPHLQFVRFHRERERLYAIADPDQRNSAFFQLHLEWFREWGLEKLLTCRLAEFPVLQTKLTILALRGARGRKDEGAELYVNESGQRTGAVAMRPERMADAQQFAGFLGHELTHLEDMVHPDFAYSPALDLPHLSPGQDRLARERYTVLWDTSIDGRLTQANRAGAGTRAQRWQEFNRAFGRWPEIKQQETFTAVWTDPRPTHRWFQDLLADAREVFAGDQPAPGAPCPLCGFPTFAWADPIKLSEIMVAAIRLEFPNWSPQQGACDRCVGVFRCRAVVDRARRSVDRRMSNSIDCPG